VTVIFDPWFSTCFAEMNDAVEKKHAEDDEVTCRQGHRHGGRLGAAGFLIRAPRPSGEMAYLLQQRAADADCAGKWGVFGGGLHPGETALEGATREVNEEIGHVNVKNGSEPSIVKVGKEGYIHGFICVRPPCGPEYEEAGYVTHSGSVTHQDEVIGSVTSSHGSYSAIYTGDGSRTELPGSYASRDDAVKRVAAYHDILALRDSLPGSSITHDALKVAGEALADGDEKKSGDYLRMAHATAKVDNGDDGLVSHVDHIQQAVTGGSPVEPKPVRPDTVIPGALAGAAASVTTPALADPNAKGFDAWLSPEDATELRSLVKDSHLSFPESRGGVYEANRLDGLKEKALTGIAVKELGLPVTVANGIAGYTDNGNGSLSDISLDENDVLGALGSRLDEWTMSGGRPAEDVSRWHERAMRMKKPEVVGSDWATALTRDGYSFVDKSAAAVKRRADVSSYYGVRMQQRYTQEVLRETSKGKPVKVTRLVTGDYAEQLKKLAASGGDWQASVRELSSWAEPKPRAEASVNRLINNEWDAGDGRAWLTTSLPQDSVFATWRGEGRLRNGVVALGEIIAISPDKKLHGANVSVSDTMP
jgi:hypothetical protein